MRLGFTAGNVRGLREGSEHTRGGCPARRTTGRPRGGLGWAADFYDCNRSATTIPPVSLRRGAVGHQPRVWKGGRGCRLLGRGTRVLLLCSPSRASAVLPFPRGCCRPHAGHAAVLWQRGSPSGRRPARHTCRCRRFTLARGGPRGVSRVVASVERRLVPPRKSWSDPSVES